MTTVSPASSTTPTSNNSTDALGSLSSNFSGFLQLLMTQLQNQDPSSPMDSSTFTTQLVQYSSVEQQINTNSNLQTLIQATQSNSILQSSNLAGKEVTVSSDQIALQNGSATAHFTAPQSEVVNIEIQAPDGTKVLQTTVQATAGNNDWTWNGKDGMGHQFADGAYKIAVTDPSETGIATTTSGTVTAVGRSGSSVSISLGGLTADVSNLQSVLGS